MDLGATALWSLVGLLAVIAAVCLVSNATIVAAGTAGRRIPSAIPVLGGVTAAAALLLAPVGDRLSRLPLALVVIALDVTCLFLADLLNRRNSRVRGRPGR